MRNTLSRNQAFVTLAGLLASVAFNAVALEGRVIDAASKRPVPGVFVIASWEGQADTPVQSRTLCVHKQIVVTDERGTFKLSDVSGNLNPFVVNRKRSVGFYKPGYRNVDHTDDFTTLFVEARKGFAPKDFEEIRRTHIPFSCGGNERDLVPLIRALLTELQPLAQTPKQREHVSERLFNLDVIESGEEVAFKNLEKRLQDDRKIGRN